MGNRHSHDESDGEDRGHSGTFRDFLKNKSPVSPSGKRNNKQDVGDGSRQVGNHSSSLSEKDTSDKPPSNNLPTELNLSTNSKPDGITKLAKVKNIIGSLLLFFILMCLLHLFLGAYDSISASRDQGRDISQHFFRIMLQYNRLWKHYLKFSMQKYVCHGCVYLGQTLFRDFSKFGKNSKKSPTKQALSKDQFVLGSQKVVQLIGEEQTLSYYVQVYLSYFTTIILV